MGTHLGTDWREGETPGLPDTVPDSAREIWANEIVKKAARINCPGFMVRLAPFPN